MRFKDGMLFANIGVGSTATFNLQGGAYVLDAHSAAWGGGSVTLERLMPDDITWATAEAAATRTATGTTGAFALPAGVYRLTVATATGVYARVSRVPGE